jgi:hypothetical protein
LLQQRGDLCVAWSDTPRALHTDQIAMVSAPPGSQQTSNTTLSNSAWLLLLLLLLL